MDKAAPVCEGALAKEKDRMILASVLRKIAIRVCSVYPSVSQYAVLVIAAIPPINLLVTERIRRMRVRDGGNKLKERKWLLEQWQ